MMSTKEKIFVLRILSIESEDVLKRQHKKIIFDPSKNVINTCTSQTADPGGRAV